jgi:hypothetical protein
MRPDEEVIKRRRGSAPFWEKHRNIIRGMFAPVTQALIEDAAICALGPSPDQGSNRIAFFARNLLRRS